jgi:hypothetical protein
MPHHRRAVGVLNLDPVSRCSGPVVRRQPFRHDPLQAHLAGMPEHRGAVLIGVFVEDDAGAAA